MKIFKLKPQQKKIRLDKFLAESLPHLTRGEIQRVIKNGFGTVNGEIELKKSKILSDNDLVEVRYQQELPKRFETKLKVVFENQDLLVVDKPAGLSTHPTPGNNQKTLVGALLSSYPELSEIGEDRFRPGIVHRLDAETSGLLVVAKTQKAFGYLKKLFQDREIEKEYIALVHGQTPQHGEFDKPIGRKTGSRKMTAGIGRPARTEFLREGVFSIAPRGSKVGVDKFSLLRIILHTGRTHQIRVHFSEGNYPVAGDRLYGGKYKKADEKLFPRQFLHATKLKFRLPTGETKTFESPLPNDLSTILKNLIDIKE